MLISFRNPNSIARRSIADLRVRIPRIGANEPKLRRLMARLMVRKICANEPKFDRGKNCETNPIKFGGEGRSGEDRV